MLTRLRLSIQTMNADSAYSTTTRANNTEFKNRVNKDNNRALAKGLQIIVRQSKALRGGGTSVEEQAFSFKKRCAGTTISVE